MKKPFLFACSLLAITQIAFLQAADAPSDPAPKSEPPSTVKPIESYWDVLSAVPPELRNIKARAWTPDQREQANAALKASLSGRGTPARLVLKVAEIADWDGLTFYSDIPNQQGYYIRVFGKFTDDWKEKLDTLRTGDTAILEGVLSSTTYRELWGKFTLSICLKDCKFTKLKPGEKPKLVVKL